MLMLQRYLLFILFFSASSILHAQSVEFVRNEGQWKGDFQYKATTGNGSVFLAANNFTYLIAHPTNADRIDGVKHGEIKGPVQLTYHAYRMTFEGAATPKIMPDKEQSWYYNYFLGKDPSKWKTGIHPSLAIDYNGLYPGIDMHVYSDKSALKYEFFIAPGANPENIRVTYEGEDAISLKNGNIIIKTSVGDITEMKPYAYQYTEKGRKEVPCRYRLKGKTISYDLYGDYDATRQLVIDPTVVFCTYTGSTVDNWGYTATYDNQGNFYSGGIAFGNGFPAGLGAVQDTFAGGVSVGNPQTDDTHGLGIECDMAIIKYNPTGTAKIYGTYIGGADNEQPHSMIVDNGGNLVIAGRTHSANFPTTPGAYDRTYNDSGDIVVVKLNPTATALAGSTYVGGSDRDGANFSGSEYLYGNLKYNYGDDARSEVLIDNAGNVYVTASTRSTDFPLANASQSAKSGAQDAVVFKLNPNLSTMLWSTYLGGSSDDAGYVMTLDISQTHLYVGGGTMSTDFPTTGTTWHGNYQGGFSDGFIARYQNSGTYPREKICFIGTSNNDQVYGLQVDLNNNVYAMGQSLGGTFPVTAGTYSNPNSCQFIIKLDNNLASNLASTVYGSGNPTRTNISPVAFLVDTCGYIYISGWGGNILGGQGTIGTTVGLPVTPDAFQSTTDGRDFYFMVLGKDMRSLLYATFYGRNATGSGAALRGEHVDGGTSRFDRSGVVYQAICGGCGGGPPLPTTPGTFSPLNGSTNCNLASLKIAFELSTLYASAAASPSARGCPPFAVQFINNSTNATGFNWTFGDNTSSTQRAPAHTYNTPGVYNVMLIVNNPNACGVTTIDTAFLTITVDSNRVKSDFSHRVIDSCGPYNVAFTNTSQYGTTPGAPGFTTFTWLFGDNTSFNGANPPVHTYSTGGTYTVTLIMRDTTACNNPDTMRKTFTVNSSNVAAAFTVKDSLCSGAPILFNNASNNATGYNWNFGDGSTSTAPAPSHIFAPGTYTVTLVVTNPATCNGIDSQKKTVTVFSSPVADFTFTPVIPVANTPISFTNASRNAVSYVWAFGDGTGSTDVNPQHMYRRTGEWTVCLEAKSKEGCVDTACKKVESDIQTGAELPTAFSPNGDGSNDRFYVRGGAIEKMDLKVFNRFGQLVFEAIDVPANDEAYGWDGTFNGKEQEMDAYAYVLNVTYIDGTTAQRKGNVTLLR